MGIILVGVMIIKFVSDFKFKVIIRYLGNLYCIIYNYMSIFFVKILISKRVIDFLLGLYDFLYILWNDIFNF